MDPDPGGNLYDTATFKASLLTVAFSSLYFYKTGKQEIPFKPPTPVPDTVVVTVIKAKPPAKKKKTIYLTFDDGPNKGTRNVKRIITAGQLPVTLFVIGEHVYGSNYQSAIYDSLSRDSLFEIANHSFTHAFENKYRQFYENPDSAVKDFARCADSLNLRTNIIRTPGRNIWRTDSSRKTDIKSSEATADSLYAHGFKAIGWDLEWHFNAEQRLVQSADEMLREIDSAFARRRTNMPEHLVILAHDQIYSNSDDSCSLHTFIDQLKQRDSFEFNFISQYPGVGKP